ncbi:hypothetical protein PHMEG_00030470 [Phytophthora megakarya]|uniref:ZSWIM1/3 RNaseH-like domain-containing protein n=1 Tax=Phytophthora megakarya TaxID=4795 RepID=A0A225V0K5_9STRA|nr:hypothetical protein PHMEG_00030470 [Phytophthora megakarya]
MSCSFKIKWTLLVLLRCKQSPESCFEQWGDTLVMDWTHRTNDLGYHLGSLAVTSATGRGIPVVDFLALDQREETMKQIVEVFKHRNPRWSGIKSVVTDKDFVEW